MPSIISLAKMETNGIRFSRDECEKQKAILQKRKLSLEQEAYHLAGRKFSLSSPKDISIVLFHELGISTPADLCIRTVKPSAAK